MDHIKNLHEWCVAEESFFSKIKDRIHQRQNEKQMEKQKKDYEDYKKHQAKSGPPYIAKDGTEFDNLDEMMQHNAYMKLPKEKREEIVRLVAQEEKRILSAIDPSIRKGFSAVDSDDNDDFIDAYRDDIWFVNWDAYDFAKAHNVYPREIWDHDDIAQPLNKAMAFVEDEMKKFLKSKNIPFSICEYGGDWDDGSYMIQIKM